jgi:putative ABC transport system permease protein
MGNALLQILLVTAVNIRTVPQRLGASLSAMVGVAGVVAVLVAVLSIAEGFQRTLATTGDERSVIVMRGGTDTEMNSALSLEATRIIADAPGILRVGDKSAASAELFVIVDLAKKSTGTVANVPLRGVQEMAFAVRPQVHIVAGRAFEPGRNEIIVGIGAVEEFSGLEIGNQLLFGDSRWTVVGHFEAAGSLPESELWVDAKVLGPAYMRGQTFQSVYARLESPEAFATFKDALTADPRLDVKVEREPDYYAGQSRFITLLVRFVGFSVALIMGLAALFGAVNTMYSAVAARTREIATLRAMGYSGGPVAVSVLFESLLIAALGAVAGAVVAYAIFNGFRAATLNWNTFSQVTFAFAVTPPLMGLGILYALLLGLAGGLFPAMRAARMPVAAALREL